MPTAEAALRKAPGVLAVEVDYDAHQATIGTAAGKEVPRDAVLEQLEAIKYKGEFVEPE